LEGLLALDAKARGHAKHWIATKAARTAHQA
jgi:hypothetical protein